jgi:hypothetical protein
MKTTTQRTAFLALALAGLTLLACAKETGGGPAPTSTETGSATTATPPTTQAPSTRAAPTAPAQVLPATAAPQIETPAALPSPAVLEAVSVARARLDGLAAGIDGARVRFVDCAEGAKCSARLEAPTLAGLRDLLQSVSADQGGIAFVAREQLDGYAGRTFVADLTLGAEAPLPVPADPGALLGLAESP